jgi:hypothetical protein
MRELKKQYLESLSVIYETKRKYLSFLHQRQLQKLVETQDRLKADIEKNFEFFSIDSGLDWTAATLVRGFRLLTATIDLIGLRLFGFFWGFNFSNATKLGSSVSFVFIKASGLNINLCLNPRCNKRL